MTHFIFYTEAAATTASAAILRLGSLALHVQKGLALRPDGVIAEGLRDGQPVPIELNPLWDVPRECAEGWAVAIPETWCIAPDVPLWSALRTALLSVIAQALGLPPPGTDIEITQTGAEWVALALDGITYTMGVPTFPDSPEMDMP
jgi:hypothetical protein